MVSYPPLNHRNVINEKQIGMNTYNGIHKVYAQLASNLSLLLLLVTLYYICIIPYM